MRLRNVRTYPAPWSGLKSSRPSPFHRSRTPAVSERMRKESKAKEEGPVGANRPTLASRCLAGWLFLRWAPGDRQAEWISRRRNSLAFSVFGVLTVAAGRLGEAALEGADETGSVFVADGVGDFLHAHIAVREEVSGPSEALLGENFAEAHAGLLLEDALDIRGTEIEFEGEFGDGAQRARLDLAEDLGQATFGRRLV